MRRAAYIILMLHFDDNCFQLYEDKNSIFKNIEW